MGGSMQRRPLCRQGMLLRDNPVKKCNRGWCAVRAFLFLMILLLFFGLASHLTVFQGPPAMALWLPGQSPVDPDMATLVMPEGEAFRILLFSDIQLGLNPLANAKALNMMDEMVARTAPHFLMTTGDNGSFVYASPLIHSLINRFESYGTPWGVVLGNHDGEGIASRNWLGLQYERAEHCVFRRGPSNVHGVGNYAVSIL